ncbi:MAG TPA: hypothetical protein VFM51_01345 [Solirubrobacterales bacterium]|nr:hypothetical protein [Solirubrobacterales bacterium]
MTVSVVALQPPQVMLEMFTGMTEALVAVVVPLIDELVHSEIPTPPPLIELLVSDFNDISIVVPLE